MTPPLREGFNIVRHTHAYTGETRDISICCQRLAVRASVRAVPGHVHSYMYHLRREIIATACTVPNTLPFHSLGSV